MYHSPQIYQTIIGSVQRKNIYIDGKPESEFLDLYYMQSECGAPPNHGYASAKDPLWSGDMYVRLRLGDGSWIKIRATEKYLDYAVSKSDRLNHIKTVTPISRQSFNSEQDAQMREIFRTAIEVAQKRKEECIETIQRNKMTDEARKNPAKSGLIAGEV